MPIRKKQPDSGSHRKGGAIVEIALLSPWLFFLFVGIFDLGFYTYAAICTENAARVAAIQTAANPALSSNQLQTMACNAASLEMVRVPNRFTFVSGCGSGPLQVSQQTLTNASSPTCADCTIDAGAISSLVTVTYQSGLFVPIPGLVKNQMNLTRTSETRMVVP